MSPRARPTRQLELGLEGSATSRRRFWVREGVAVGCEAKSDG